MKNIFFIELAEDHKSISFFKKNRLEYFKFETQNENFIGQFFKGKIQRILPELNVAFVNIGLEKNALLRFDQAVNKLQKKNHFSPKNIKEIVFEGQNVLVQLTKLPHLDKSAQVSMKLAYFSPHLILKETNNSKIIFPKNTIFTEKKKKKFLQYFNPLMRIPFLFVQRV